MDLPKKCRNRLCESDYLEFKIIGEVNIGLSFKNYLLRSFLGTVNVRCTKCDEEWEFKPLKRE